MGWNDKIDFREEATKYWSEQNEYGYNRDRAEWEAKIAEMWFEKKEEPIDIWHQPTNGIFE